MCCSFILKLFVNNKKCVFVMRLWYAFLCYPVVITSTCYLHCVLIARSCCLLVNSCLIDYFCLWSVLFQTSVTTKHCINLSSELYAKLQQGWWLVVDLCMYCPLFILGGRPIYWSRLVEGGGLSKASNYGQRRVAGCIILDANLVVIRRSRRSLCMFTYVMLVRGIPFSKT